MRLNGIFIKLVQQDLGWAGHPGPSPRYLPTIRFTCIMPWTIEGYEHFARV